MRVIKFRGKRVDNGEWVYGFYVIQDGTPKIYNDISEKEWNIYPVDPSTVGQFTGLSDKNGKEIYEGDIFRTIYPNCMAVVTWDVECARFIGYTIKNERRIVYVDMIDKNNDSAVEIIGNIHDNSELMEV